MIRKEILLISLFVLMTIWTGSVRSKPLTNSPVKLPNVITVYGISSDPDIEMTQSNYANKLHQFQTDDYFAKRANFLRNEFNRSLGSDIILNEQELTANEIIKRLKLRDLEVGLMNPYEFTPARHFFEVKDIISNSNLFKFIELMPKGGVLHAHDTALVSIKYILNGILFNPKYKEILWYCTAGDDDLVKFQFARKQPEYIENFTDWILLADARDNSDDINSFDEKLRRTFTLFTEDPLKDFKDINYVWRKFINIFIALDPIVKYAPVWEEYFYQALEEFQQDNVQYLEFRGLLPRLYDLDGTNYTEMDTFEIYKKTLDRFMVSNPNFIGAKFIYGPNRKVNNITFDDYMTTVKSLKKAYPDFLAGFDLVAQEDKGNPLKDYIPQLLDLHKTNPQIEFFFHAGETNWNGLSVDENLIDAILLGTKRIGHGYAILKHPSVMDALKQQNIAIEINPISNQVLKLVADNRNHPAAHLFADNYPVVVSSDDPSFWEAKPLSHDFYIAFMGMASGHSDLKFLKKLAENSIQYSSLNDMEKNAAKLKWQKQWNLFIEYVNLNENQFI